MGIVVDILSTKAFMQLFSINVMRCVEYFEGEAENIYFLDNAERYTGKVLQRKDFRLSGDTDLQMFLPLVSLEPIVFSLPIKEENSKALQVAINAAFTQKPEASEFPIVGNDGHIVAVARLHKESRPALDWKKLSGKRFELPEGKLYISSIENADLKAMFETLKEVSDMELMTESNFDMIISGKADGTLIYGVDIYPDIRKISVEELYKRLILDSLFYKNQEAFKSCAGFHMDFDESPATEGNQPQVESKVKSFLSQVESDLPIILEDAYDIEEITWMCDRLRGSDKFGSDNNLYLKYSSWPDFLKSMETLDWTEIARSGKAVFLFSDEQKQKYYPTSAKLGTPQPLQIDEIIEMVNSFPRSFSGSDFFNMILDSHPSLLTIGWHGLSSFTMLWKVFCKDKTVKEAVEHLRKPNGKKELKLHKVNLSNMLKYKYEERLPVFLEGLSLYLNPEEKYGIHDWFKAFYLSANAAVGRKFLQRITPAVFYDEHGGMGKTEFLENFSITTKEVSTMKNEVLSGFKYKRYAGVVRSPLGKFGCGKNYIIKVGERSYWKSPLVSLKSYARGNSYGHYLKESDSIFPNSCHVRFEDLKLYPRETIEKLCEFLRIPWSETCLHITTNGEDSGIVDGTAGFDTRPVYNPHLEYMSTLDYYRIELLNAKNFQVYGYKLKYYDGTKYTAEDLEKLFAIPFKVETQELDPKKWPGWPNQEEIKEFHEWILKRALEVMEHGEKDYSVDKDGKPLRLVEVLVPDLAPGQKLFEC